VRIKRFGRASRSSAPSPFACRRLQACLDLGTLDATLLMEEAGRTLVSSPARSSKHWSPCGASQRWAVREKARC
jgi:hypothetical protein